MHDHSRRLIDSGQEFIFVEHVKRNILRHRGCRGLLKGEDFNLVTCAQHMACFRYHPTHADTVMIDKHFYVRPRARQQFGECPV